MRVRNPVQELCDQAVRDGYETVDQMPETLRRRIVAELRRQRHHSARFDLAYLVEGDTTRHEPISRAYERDARLEAAVDSYMTDADVAYAHRIAEELAERAVRFEWEWLEKQLSDAWRRHGSGRWEEAS